MCSPIRRWLESRLARNPAAGISERELELPAVLEAEPKVLRSGEQDGLPYPGNVDVPVDRRGDGIAGWVIVSPHRELIRYLAKQHFARINLANADQRFNHLPCHSALRRRTQFYYQAASFELDRSRTPH